MFHLNVLSACLDKPGIEPHQKRTELLETKQNIEFEKNNKFNLKKSQRIVITGTCLQFVDMSKAVEQKIHKKSDSVCCRAPPYRAGVKRLIPAIKSEEKKEKYLKLVCFRKWLVCSPGDYNRRLVISIV